MIRLAARWLWKPVALLLALLAVWLRGRASAKQQAAARDSAAYRDTRKGMDDVQNDIGMLPDDARQRMRDRNPNQR